MSHELSELSSIQRNRCSSYVQLCELLAPLPILVAQWVGKGHEVEVERGFAVVHPIVMFVEAVVELSILCKLLGHS